MVRFIKKIAARFLLVTVGGMKVLFQMQRGCCRFYPSCSEYAAEAIENMPVGEAIPLIVKRVLKCHPFSRGGFDPVSGSVIPWRVEKRE
jgi:putative membrane protein insertion efficiency factor